MHQEFDPPSALQDIIECFWYDRRDLGEQQTGFEVLPDGYAEIIFYFGNTVSISTSKGLQSLPSPFLTGLLDQPAIFYTRDRLEVIGIRCYPWTVFDLLGLPSGKDGIRTFEHPVARLQPLLNKWIQAGKIEEAVEAVNQYFLNAKAKIPTDSMLFKAGIAMREANGSIPVNQVSAAAHATVRTLERKFKQAAGYTVKDVSSVMRFQQVRNQLWMNPDSNLAGLAHELGYTDQSHLGKEFKRYTGTTPAAFARKVKKEKQVGNDFVAFIQA
ncbi:MAG: DUF6597 domain-containing transcriptional factor [Niastella sp.]|uniref:DUF6597 domain-containing transcriptional factor n=1 Tax=Niastella sp. TaxID=1869183 RepID=UPI00389A05A0